MSFYSRRASYWDQYDFIDANPLATKPAPKTIDHHISKELKLEELLNDKWLEELSSTIQSQAECLTFIGPLKHRPENIIPQRQLLFNSFNSLPPHRWRVIMLGESNPNQLHKCSGYSYMEDKNITSWSDEACPKDMRAIIHNVLMTYGLVHMGAESIDNEVDDKNDNQKTDESSLAKQSKSNELDAILTQIRQQIPMNPLEWWQYTSTQGVLWLNMALTCGGLLLECVHVYTRMFALFFFTLYVQSTYPKKINTYTHTQKQRGDGNGFLKAKLKKPKKQRGTVFVVSNKADKKFVRSVQSSMQTSKQGCPPIRVIEIPHPKKQSESFSQQRVFKEINETLDSMSMPGIYWLPKEFVQKLNDSRTDSSNQSSTPSSAKPRASFAPLPSRDTPPPTQTQTQTPTSDIAIKKEPDTPPQGIQDVKYAHINLFVAKLNLRFYAKKSFSFIVTGHKFTLIFQTKRLNNILIFLMVYFSCGTIYIFLIQMPFYPKILWKNNVIHTFKKKCSEKTLAMVKHKFIDLPAQIVLNNKNISIRKTLSMIV
ncbi:uracil-DNA glycosylase [Reticulomyxa filosa]|uniref:Uracil-DNA glycosylase n=1 Tax=Reticulomyxa filosa TaxID=46433 RepID=X6NR04_RETFI|nr:uracil-DNA glycosylase [Reticulomyxa filosa]|eukprot:ETO28416.1 uracil-DNA glycosylase [Reticulomyxa filosa]